MTHQGENVSTQQGLGKGLGSCLLQGCGQVEPISPDTRHPGPHPARGPARPALSDWTGPVLGPAGQQSTRLQPFCPRSYLRKAASCLAAESNIFEDEEIPTFF